MKKYYKANTHVVDITQYRDYILGNFRCSPVLEMDIYNCYPCRNVHRVDDKNHPKVKKGLAFWVNKTYICTGYDIGSVFRPIFNHKREKLALNVRICIVRYAKILASSARNHLYKKELMKLHNKKIPEEVVEHIADYAWDIMLLLYP
jgi:hypothetical protein